MNHWQLAGLIGLGGSIGSLLRYGASRFAAIKRTPTYYATLTVNVAGSFAMGLLTGMHMKADAPTVFAFAGTGVLGGLTTYSTLNVQKAELAREGRRSTLIAYAAAAYLGGWAAFAGGWLVGRNLLG